MGLTQSTSVPDQDAAARRERFIRCIGSREFSARGKRFTVYSLQVGYGRYTWVVHRRFSEIVRLHRRLCFEVDGFITKGYQRPPKIVFNHRSQRVVERRKQDLGNYLQAVLDDDGVWDAVKMQEFLEIGAMSFDARLGRKGKEGYLQKCSGGYHAQFSTRAGEMFRYWRKRWVVLTDRQILYFRTRRDTVPLGSLQIDPGFSCAVVGKYLRVENRTRLLVLRCKSMRVAEEWIEEIKSFYSSSPHRGQQPHFSWNPIRFNTDMRVFVRGMDTLAAMAMAMLTARHEIYIAGWMVSPTVLLTRPPLPPVRLDQLLAYKAHQGVKIYILLYKEVEMAMPNASNKAKSHLSSLHATNIHVIRHPNKFMGGSTAMWWSHHDKVVVVDCRMAFIGGIDLTFGRWDSKSHRLEDEDGVRFPGEDYYNPGPEISVPVCNPFEDPALSPQQRAAARRQQKQQQQQQQQSGSTAPKPKLSTTAVPVADLPMASASAVEPVPVVELDPDAMGLLGGSDAINPYTDPHSDVAVNRDQQIADGLLDHSESTGRTASEVVTASGAAAGAFATTAPTGDAAATAATAAATAVAASGSPDPDAEVLSVHSHDSRNPGIASQSSSSDDDDDDISDDDGETSLLPKLRGGADRQRRQERRARRDARRRQRQEQSQDTSTTGQNNNNNNTKTRYSVNDNGVTYDHDDGHDDGGTLADDVDGSDRDEREGARDFHNETVEEKALRMEAEAHEAAFAEAASSDIGINKATIDEQPRKSDAALVVADKEAIADEPTTAELLEQRDGDEGEYEAKQDGDDKGDGKKRNAVLTGAGMLGQLQGFFTSIGDVLSSPQQGAPVRRRRPMREVYPRMPWHDVHACVTGPAARDLAAHFIQRWNHHRLSKRDMRASTLMMPTDIPNFGVCCRCGVQVPDADTACRACNHPLYVASPLECPRPMFSEDLDPTRFPYVLYDVDFEGKMGITVAGDGPSVITNVARRPGEFPACDSFEASSDAARDMVAAAIAKDPDFLKPRVGDVLIKVNNTGVNHLSYQDVRRFIGRTKLRLDQEYAKQLQERFGSGEGVSASKAEAGGDDKRLLATDPQAAMQRVPSKAISPPVGESPEVAPAAVGIAGPEPDPELEAAVGAVEQTGTESAVSAVSVDQRVSDDGGGKLRTSVSGPDTQGGGAGAGGVSSAEAGNGDTAGNTSEMGDVEVPPPKLRVQFRRFLRLDDEVEGRLRAQFHAWFKFPAPKALLQHVEDNTLFPPTAKEALLNAATKPTYDSAKITMTVEEQPGEADLEEHEMPEPSAMQKVVQTATEVIAHARGREAAPAVGETADPEATGAIAAAEGAVLGDGGVSLDCGVGADQGQGRKEDGPNGREEDADSEDEDDGLHAHHRGPLRAQLDRLAERVEVRAHFRPQQLPFHRARTAVQLEGILSLSRLAHKPSMLNLLPNQQSNAGSCQVQLLRSLGMWSAGIKEKEASIFNAYTNLINGSRHFVYIENQFFVSSMNRDDMGAAVRNAIGDAILERLRRAVFNKEDFRMIVVIPLHPEGDYINERSVGAVMHYQFGTICRGGKSLLEEFQRECPDVDPFDYISFYSLRTYDCMRKRAVSEQIYVHDKLMIVDDEFMIIGSANINDRSQLGDRDSEIAICVRDTRMVPATMKGNPVHVSYIPAETRKRLWRKHFGIADNDTTVDLSDPISDESYLRLWRETANHNRAIYEDYLDQKSSVWQCATLEMHSRARPLPPEYEVVRAGLENIRGYVVPFPLDFLRDERLAPDFGAADAEAILPDYLWV